MTSLTRFSALALAAVGSLALVGCNAAAEDNPGDATGDGDVLSIVASTAIWADIAESVVDSDEVEVTAIVEGNDADPHSFEPTAADIARTAEADLIVVGGGGYDAWLHNSQDEDKIIHALPLTDHDHDHDHAEHEDEHETEPAAEGNDHSHDHGEIESIDGNEHIWYDTDAVTRVAEEITERIQEINPDVATDTTEITTAMDDIHARLHTLPEIQVAQTEPIADYLLAHSDITEITPEGYRSASLSHSEPAAADLAEFLELIDSGELDLLIYNPQTQTDLTERIRTAAEDADIPVVEVYETPQADENFITFFEDAVDRLTEISLEITGDQPDAAE